MTFIERPSICGQRILYIGTGFFEYDSIIASGIRSMGAEVDLIYDRPLEQRMSNLFFGLINSIPTLGKAGQHLHEARVIKYTNGKRYDCVMAVNGTALDKRVYDYLRKQNPQARFILYLWDSIARIKNYPDLKSRFDRCLTFDRHDALSDQSLIFRPNFFVQAGEVAEVAPRGIIFVGSLHSNRLKLIRSIEAQAAALEIPMRIYLRSGILKYSRKLFMGDADSLRWRALPYDKYLQWSREAEAILDLPYPSQTGLTQRTLDAVGLGKKIITSNADIVNYSFYSPENVCVISDTRPVIPSDFLNGSSAYYEPSVVKPFSLHQWIADVLGI